MSILENTDIVIRSQIDESKNVLKIKLPKFICRLRLESNNPYSIENVIRLLKEESKNYHIEINNEVSLPVKKKRFTVLKSPHIDKKSREQFEIRSYSKLVDVYDYGNTKLNSYLASIKGTITEDVSIKAKFKNLENI